MTPLVHVALVPKGKAVDPSELSSVAAALAIQVSRDFGPIWGVNATVSSFASPQDVPVGYWPIFIVDPNSLPADEGGVHLDKRNQPYAVIKGGDGWSLDASHECLEMLCDPGGNRMHAAPLLEQAVKLGQPAGQVQYIVEVCDPIEDASFGYQINGVLVSDFLTPDFYDTFGSGNVKYDFTSSMKQPLQVLKNGYISWSDPATDQVWQLLSFGQDQLRNLSQNAAFQAELEKTAYRPAIDRFTEKPDYLAGASAEMRQHWSGRSEAVAKAAGNRAAKWTAEISALR